MSNATSARNENRVTEGKPGLGSAAAVEEALERAFLSPRVVDQRAVDEFGNAMRSLMRDAVAQGKALTEAGSQVRTLTDQLRDARKQIEARVEAAAKLLPAIDQRLEKAQRAAEQARGTPAPSALRPAEPSAVPAGMTEAVLAARVQEVAERVVKELLAARTDDASALTTQLTDHISRLDRTITEAEVVAQRCQTVTNALDAAATRAREAGEAAARAAESAEARLEAVNTSIERAAAAVRDAQSSLDQTVSEAGLRVGAAVAEAERRASLVLRLLDDRGSGVPEAIVAVRLEEAATNARSVGDALAALVARGQIVGNGLDSLIRSMPERHD